MIKLSFVEETKREAEQIKRELAAHPELEEIHVTSRIDSRIKESIRKYLQEKERGGKQDHMGEIKCV